MSLELKRKQLKCRDGIQFWSSTPRAWATTQGHFIPLKTLLPLICWGQKLHIWFTWSSGNYAIASHLTPIHTQTTSKPPFTALEQVYSYHVTNHLYLEERRHCQRNSEAKRLIARFWVVFQSLSDCLSSVFWGFTNCFGRNTALFCAQCIKSPSQHLAGILLWAGIPPPKSNFDSLFLPRLVSSSHTSSHREWNHKLTWILYLNTVYFKMNYFLSYRVLLLLLHLLSHSLGFEGLLVSIRCLKTVTPDSVGMGTLA